jgi:tetratricopeptide (TPR) repeat protein
MFSKKTTENQLISATEPQINHKSSFPWQTVYKSSLILILIAMTGMSFWYGLSGDEVDMSEYGKAILKYYTSFFSDETVFNMPKEYDRDAILKYYGGFYDTICAIITKISPLELFTTRHILNAFMGFVAIFYTSKIALRIMNYQAATIAVWLMFLSPFFLGHAMNNPKDIPFAAFYVMSIYFIIKLFDNLPDPSKKQYVFAILSIGAAIGSRVGGILLIPEMLVFAGIIFIVKKYFQHEKVSLFQFAKPIGITAFLGYLAGCLVWPFGLQNPISNPLFALSEMTNLKVGMKQLFEGTKVFSTEFPWYYLPKSFAITNTFAVLGGLALMLVFLFQFRKNKNAAILYFVAFSAFFPFAYIIYSKSNVFHAWRHTLFIFPSAIVVATFGWQCLLNYLENKKIKLAGMGMLGFLLLEPLYFIATTFPNTVTYYNSIVGGVNGAYGNYEMDYYYNSLKQATDWFKKNELPKVKNGDSITVVSNAIHLVMKYFPDNKNIKFEYIRYYERNQKPWDYAIMHIALIPNEDLITKAWLPPSTLFQAQVQGNTLCAVIKRPSYDDLKAFEFLQINQADSAIQYFNYYLQKDSLNTNIMNVAGNIALQTNKMDLASQYINKSYGIDSSSAETKQLKGMLSMQNGDFATAQVLFTQLLAENPQYIQGYYYLGLAQMNSGNLQQALSNFNTASQDEKMRGTCYKLMGDIQMKLGNATEAQKLYQAAGITQ